MEIINLLFFSLPLSMGQRPGHIQQVERPLTWEVAKKTVLFDVEYSHIHVAPPPPEPPTSSYWKYWRFFDFSVPDDYTGDWTEYHAEKLDHWRALVRSWCIKNSVFELDATAISDLPWKSPGIAPLPEKVILAILNGMVARKRAAWMMSKEKIAIVFLHDIGDISKVIYRIVAGEGTFGQRQFVSRYLLSERDMLKTHSLYQGELDGVDDCEVIHALVSLAEQNVAKFELMQATLSTGVRSEWFVTFFRKHDTLSSLSDEEKQQFSIFPFETTIMAQRLDKKTDYTTANQRSLKAGV